MRRLAGPVLVGVLLGVLVAGRLAGWRLVGAGGEVAAVHAGSLVVLGPVSSGVGAGDLVIVRGPGGWGIAEVRRASADRVRAVRPGSPASAAGRSMGHGELVGVVQAQVPHAGHLMRLLAPPAGPLLFLGVPLAWLAATLWSGRRSLGGQPA